MYQYLFAESIVSMFTRNTLGSESLRAVGGNGVPMIDVAHLGWIEGDDSVFVVVHVGGHFAVLGDCLNGSKIAVGNAQHPSRSSELQPVACSKLALDLMVSGDSARS
jgi:hypothetical protein